MVMLEAMTAGTPVLAVEAEGSAAAEVSGEGRGALCGLSELGGEITRLLEDDGLKKRFTEGGYRYARERKYGKIVDEVQMAYKEAILDGRL